MSDENLPPAWEATTLGEALDAIVGGGTPPKNKPEYFQGDIPLMTVKDMRESRPTSTGFNITREGLENSSAKLIPSDTVVIATRMGLGKVVRAPFETAINQDLKALFPSPGIDRSYLEFWLLSLAKKLGGMGTGTTVKGLRLEKLKSLEFPLAPSNEQHRIVEKIETLFARIDKGEEALREVQKLLKRYRQSILKAAVTGELTRDWREARRKQRWDNTTLGNLVEFLTSGSRGWAKYYSDTGDIFIRAQNLKHDRLELGEIAYVQIPTKSEGTRTLVRKGDLLITITGANVTKTALVREDLGRAYVSQHVALFRPTSEVDSEFLYWFLLAKHGGRQQLETFAYGAGKPGLNLQNIRDVSIAIPSLEEQKEIVQEIEAFLSKQEDLEHEVSIQLQRTSLLRQSILKSAFTGQLVPQDPGDELASELLARIRADA